LRTRDPLDLAEQARCSIRPIETNRAFASTAKRAGLDGVGIHTLRHSAGSAMLAAGAPLHTVSEILGHFSVAITGDVYGHVTTDGACSAVDLLSSMINS
jgi:site-specific recombinase XerD